eukprot:2354607-Pyramimonas_sp.AAC.2
MVTWGEFMPQGAGHALDGAVSDEKDVGHPLRYREVLHSRHQRLLDVSAAPHLRPTPSDHLSCPSGPPAGQSEG